MKNTTLKKLFAITLLAITSISCNVNINPNIINGNGNVITETKALQETFENISVSNGIEVKLKQGASNPIKITTDENLQSLIKTEVKNNTLYIETSGDFSTSTGIIVEVSMPKIFSIITNSGATLISENTIMTPNITLSSSSGSELNVKIETDHLIVDSSSGSEIEVEGKALKAEFSSTSGSSIEAENLKANDIFAQSSSGSSIEVYPIVSLTATASSGSSIRYKNSPTNLSINENSGGSITK